MRKSDSSGVNTPTPSIPTAIPSLPNKSSKSSGSAMAGKQTVSNSLMTSGVASLMKTMKSGKC